MTQGVAVTGIGIVSALGNGVQSNYISLSSSSPGLSYPEILKTQHSNLPVGEVKMTNEELAEMLSLKTGHSFTRASLLGAVASKEAISSSYLKKEQLTDSAFISGTSVGGIDHTEKYYLEFEKNVDNRRFIEAQHPGFTTSQIGKFIGVGGYTTTISTACSSAANAIMLGARLIKAGKIKRAVVGGTDCLSKFTLNGFNSLLILSEEPCRPFDENRKGLNLGEGAAYLVLEANEYIKNKKVFGYISGYGNANDAFHQTASSKNGEGAFLAMKKALKTSRLNPSEIDYINAHGTATKNNDLSESKALLRLFKEGFPDLSSTKSFTGHCLAAAGGIEAVFSLLSLQKSEIFPNLNFEQPISETGIVPQNSHLKKDLRHILSNSFGFGGNCTSLIFTKNG